jgi:hypothetical protein
MTMAEIIDDAKVGKRGYPRHWRELGREPPKKEAPEKTQEQKTEDKV